MVRVAPDGTQTTVGAGLSDPQGVAVDAGGNVYIADTDNDRAVRVAPDGTPTTVGAGLNAPFGVAVDPAADAATLLSALHEAVQGVGPGTSLADKVAAAQTAQASGDTAGACTILTDFINQVRVQSGKKIPAATAEQLIADARLIQDVLAC